jgi:signal transduction histidine kinase
MKEQFQIKTIRAKISLFVFASVAICIAIAAGIVSMVIENQLEKNYAVARTAAIESLSNSLTVPFKLYDYNQIERIIRSALIYQSVAYVSVNKMDGGLIVAATEQGISTGDLEVLRYALTDEGYLIGSFDIGFSRAYIDSQIRTTTGALTLGLMGFLLLMGAVLSLFINNQITDPMVKFTNIVKDIDPDHLSSRVLINKQDEIGVLAANFNRMADELEAAHTALQKSNDDLEIKISERTAELNQRNQELAASNIRLEEMSLHKSQFLANMSHELRTPLNSIIGYTKLILNKLEGDINEEQEKDLQAVYNNGKTLLELINGLLDLSKIEAGKTVLSCGVFNASDLIDEVTTTVEPLIKERELTLTCSIAPGIERIYADRAKTRQVLINIMGNAVKFTSNGGITLNLSENDDYFLFSVTDTGMGIKKEDLETIFDSFVQVGPSQIAGYAGTGLGLAVSKQFIEMQGGKIWAESDPGHGSTFFFTIPKEQILHL